RGRRVMREPRRQLRLHSTTHEPWLEYAFDSPRVCPRTTRAVSSAVEHALHTRGVTGSIPVPPTTLSRVAVPDPGVTLSDNDDSLDRDDGPIHQRSISDDKIYRTLFLLLRKKATCLTLPLPLRDSAKYLSLLLPLRERANYPSLPLALRERVGVRGLYNHRHTNRAAHGFTLIELVVVIVILGILAAVALPRFVTFAREARIAKLEAARGAVGT